MIHCQEEDEMAADGPSSDEASLSNSQSREELIVSHSSAQDTDDESGAKVGEEQNTENDTLLSCDAPNTDGERSQQFDPSIIEANQNLDGASPADSKRTDDESDTLSKEVVTDNNSFLANARVEDVVLPEESDDSFLEGAQIEVPNVDPYDDCNQSHSDDDTKDDSYFDMYASNMSRGTASIVSYSVGNEVLQKSNLAQAERNAQANGKNRLVSDAGDDSTLGTYDYQRAYLDMAVNSTTCSALTDDYAMADRGKFGMDDVFMTSRTQRHLDSDQSSKDPMERGFPPLSEDHAVPGVISPAYIVNQQHLLAKGYIDEEAAQIYNPPSYGRAKSGCCVWFRSSPRAIKMIVVASLVLMVVGIASLSAAIMIPRVSEGSDVNSNGDVNAASSNSRFDGLPEKQLGIIRPTLSPSVRESDWPTYSPSNGIDKPTESPTVDLSASDGYMSSDRDVEMESSSQPSTEPTGRPTTSYPTESQDTVPTLKPITQASSREPTANPSRYPTSKPSNRPVLVALPPVSSQPTVRPSPRPTTSQPSKSPVTGTPTRSPSYYPTYWVTTLAPVTRAPTEKPTRPPVTVQPFFPTRWPTKPPTNRVRLASFCDRA